MPNGLEYVESTLGKMERLSTQVGALAGVDAAWVADAQRRLAAVAELLKGTTGRFFLKTKVCLPFARKCEEATTGLEALVAGPAGPPEIEAALVSLEKAARTLDERSMMQGMAIT